MIKIIGIKSRHNAKHDPTWSRYVVCYHDIYYQIEGKSTSTDGLTLDVDDTTQLVNINITELIKITTHEQANDYFLQNIQGQINPLIDDVMRSTHENLQKRLIEIQLESALCLFLSGQTQMINQYIPRTVECGFEKKLLLDAERYDLTADDCQTIDTNSELNWSMCSGDTREDSLDEATQQLFQLLGFYDPPHQITNKYSDRLWDILGNYSDDIMSDMIAYNKAIIKSPNQIDNLTQKCRNYWVDHNLYKDIINLLHQSDSIKPLKST